MLSTRAIAARSGVAEPGRGAHAAAAADTGGEANFRAALAATKAAQAAAAKQSTQGRVDDRAAQQPAARRSAPQSGQDRGGQPSGPSAGSAAAQPGGSGDGSTPADMTNSATANGAAAARARPGLGDYLARITGLPQVAAGTDKAGPSGVKGASSAGDGSGAPPQAVAAQSAAAGDPAMLGAQLAAASAAVGATAAAAASPAAAASSAAAVTALPMSAIGAAAGDGVSGVDHNGPAGDPGPVQGVAIGDTEAISAAFANVGAAVSGALFDPRLDQAFAPRGTNAPPDSLGLVAQAPSRSMLLGGQTIGIAGLAVTTDYAAGLVAGGGAGAAATPGQPQTAAGADGSANGVMDQVSHPLIGLVSGGGGHEIVLHLSPPELGDVSVRVLVSGREVSAWFDAPQAPVQEAISQGMGQLHSDLANAGYNLNGAWVGGDAWTPRGRQGSPAAPRPTGEPAATRGVEEASGAAAPPAAWGVSVYV